MSEKINIFERPFLLGEGDEEEIKTWIDLQKAFLTEKDIKEEEDDLNLEDTVLEDEPESEEITFGINL